MTTSDAVAIAADVIAVGALAFTIVSFWTLYARVGKLQIVGEPRSYAFAAPAGRFCLNLPLVFSNSRPSPAVAVNLRLRLDAPGFPSTVSFQATLDGLYPAKPGRIREMATSIVVQGRETRLLCCEFIAEPCDVVVAGPVTVPITVEALVWRRWLRPRWQSLLTFPLRLPDDAILHRGAYLTYDNQVAVSS